MEKTELKPFRWTKQHKGQLKIANWKALDNYKKWNDITGYPPKNTSYDFEIQSVIEDAVKYGYRQAVATIINTRTK